VEVIASPRAKIRAEVDRLEVVVEETDLPAGERLVRSLLVVAETSRVELVPWDVTRPPAGS
jgi:hypothetical protein